MNDQEKQSIGKPVMWKEELRSWLEGTSTNIHTTRLIPFYKDNSALDISSEDSYVYKHKGRKWEQRTPAMAAGLTDHIWSIEELLVFHD